MKALKSDVEKPAHSKSKDSRAGPHCFTRGPELQGCWYRGSLADILIQADIVQWLAEDGHVVILIDENDFHVGIAHMVGHTLIGEEVKVIVVHHLRAQEDGQSNANVFCFSLDRGRGADEILGISSHQVNLEHAVQAHIPLLCVILSL